jgi:putative flippase GtrA
MNLRDTYERVRHHEITGQFVRYAAIGVLNVALFFLIFNLLTPDRASFVRVNAARALAFIITSIISFALNKVWAFKDQRRERIAHQYARFVFFTLVGFAFQQGLFSLLLIPLHQYGRLGWNAANVPAIPLSVLWNFTAYRRWTFNAVTAPAPSN